MRICSLLPSATEIVADLGLAGSLVGVSEECDWPPQVRGVPVVTASRVDMTRFSVLPKQQASDEKAAQCEEEIDALSSKVLEWILDNLKEYIVGMNSVKVKAHHRNDCDATNEVQFDRTSGFRGSRPAK